MPNFQQNPHQNQGDLQQAQKCATNSAKPAHTSQTPMTSNQTPQKKSSKIMHYTHAEQQV